MTYLLASVLCLVLLANVHHITGFTCIRSSPTSFFGAPTRFYLHGNRVESTMSSTKGKSGGWDISGAMRTLAGKFGSNESTTTKTDSSNKPAQSKLENALSECDAQISAALSLLEEAAATKSKESEEVIGALLSLEKLMRKRNKLDEGQTSKATLEQLNGAWRLIFTTGTVDTQKKLGKINYFPVKAVQSFDTASSPMKITNGIYVFDSTFAALQFFGEFSWNEKARKLEFDFDAISVLGLKFNLPKGGAAKVGSKTGLGSESNVQLANKGRKPFFNWISAGENVATARGGGGGLALWKRDALMESILLPTVKVQE